MAAEFGRSGGSQPSPASPGAVGHPRFHSLTRSTGRFLGRRRVRAAGAPGGEHGPAGKMSFNLGVAVLPNSAE